MLEEFWLNKKIQEHIFYLTDQHKCGWRMEFCDYVCEQR